jgi:hypothetical protein
VKTGRMRPTLYCWQRQRAASPASQSGSQSTVAILRPVVTAAASHYGITCEPVAGWTASCLTSSALPIWPLP